MPSQQTHLCSLACVLVAALCTPLDALATDYFVRKTGNDANAGTSAATAWLTFDYAMEHVLAGDTVYVGAGTYDEVINPANGTCFGIAGNPIQFIADTDGSQTGDAGNVILTNSSGAVNVMAVRGDWSNHDYLTFQGFRFTGGTIHAVQITQCVGIEIENCEVDNGGGAGIRCDGGTIVIRNSSFHDNSSQGIYLRLGAVGTIEDTVSYSNSKAIWVSTSATATVNRCRFYDNLSTGVTVEDGIATLNNCLITGNLIGIRVNPAGGNITVQNCTVAKNTSYGFYFLSGTHVITNCIIANNTNKSINDTSNVTRTNNLLWGNGGTNGNATANGTEFVADPQFRSATDYHIIMLSPARNAGIDLSGTVDDDLEGRARPYDGHYDIGCYEEGPIGHWRLDETSGTTAADSSGLGNDGTHTNGPTLGVEGIYAKATDFDGTNDFVDLPDMQVDYSQGFSTAFWFNPVATSNLYSGFVGISNGSATDEIWIGWAKGYGIELYFSDPIDGTEYQLIDDNIEPIPGKWQHYVASVDASGNAKIYRDGVEVASGFVSLPSNVARTVNHLGSTVNDDFFSGKIDDVRLYNRPLSATEVFELYGLMGHWKLDETSGTVAADSSGLGNDGTYTNGPTLGNCGPYENAANFDGTDDHVDLSDMNIDYSDGFSAAVWIKPSADPNTFYAFFGTANGVSDDEIWFGYVGTFLKLFVSDTTDGSASHVLLDNSAEVLNKWQHCVVTIDAFGNGKLYRNGVETASGFVSLPANIARTENFIGTSVYNDEFPGALDDMRIYNRALTPRQVAELYGLVGHWKLDETSGTTAADSSGMGIDGIYNNAPTLGVPSNGVPLGTAVDFDGLNDYVEVPHDSRFLADDGTVALWFKANDLSSEQAIFSKDSSGFDTGGHLSIYHSSSTISVRMQSTSTSYNLASASISAGVWYHVALTWGVGGMKLFVDGVEVDANSLYTGGLGLTSGGSGNLEPLVIGAATWVSGNLTSAPVTSFFDGTIDEIRVFKRALCPEEVFGQYKAGRPAGIRILKWVEVR